MNKEVVRFIKKSNDLVEARYKFGIWETRIFTKMITLIRRGDEDFKDYKIYLKDIIHDFSLEKNKEAYDLLREGARKLMKKTFYIPYEKEGVKRLFETPVVSSLDSTVYDEKNISDEHLYLTISFHPKMKPFLLQLKSQFTMYDVRNILRLPSTYSIRIYELLKQYEKIGWRFFSVQELKEILGIEDKYKLYGHFKKRVLLKAQKDLAEHTDLKFTFEEIKEVRAVHKLKFRIYKNSVKEQLIEKETKTNAKPIVLDYDAELFNELWQQIKKYDITEDTLKKWLREFRNNPNHVKNCIRYTLNRLKKGEKMSTVGGYVNSLLKQGTLFDADEEKKNKAKEQKKVTAKKEAQKKKLATQLKQLSKEWSSKKQEIIEAIFSEQPEIKNTLLEKTKSNKFSQYEANKTDEENLANPMFRAAFRSAVEKEFTSKFEALKNEYETKIKGLEREIRRL